MTRRRGPRHYRAAKGTHPCKADLRPWGRHFTTDVAQVTCPSCLFWIIRTANAELQGQREERQSVTPDGIRRAAHRGRAS